jgi:hypothetical protein
MLGFTLVKHFSDKQSFLEKKVILPERPLFELTVLCGGTCDPDDPMEIWLRLYKSSEAEMEGLEKGRYITQRFPLLPEEIQNLVRLAQSRGFQDAQSKYTGN